MIFGVGVDIVEIERFVKIKDIDRFLDKLFTSNEKEYINSKKKNYETIAGYFAAKEAISKAMKTGIIFSFKDIEIVKHGYVPYVHLHNKAKMIAEIKKISEIHLSISHSDNYAVAFAVAQMKD